MNLATFPIGSAIAILAMALVISLVAVPIAREVGRKHHFVSVAREDRFSREVVPKSGGLALFVAATAPLVLDFHRDTSLVLVVVGAVVITLVGFVDDVWSLSARIRILAELSTALVLGLGGIRLEIDPPWLSVVIGALVMLVIINGFNLLDNMDGLAATAGTSIAVSLAVAGVYVSERSVYLLACSVAGVLIGFLVYNWHPATIYLGDSGSLLVGYLLAVGCLKSDWSGVGMQNVAATLLMLSPIIFDTSLVVYSRLVNRRAISQGGTDHSSHRLAKLGLNVRSVTLLYGFASAATGFVGVSIGVGWLTWYEVGVPTAILLLLLFLALTLVNPYDEREAS